MSANGGLRKRRTHKFVQIPSSTIRDKRLSFRARGLLAYLLDMPDGWDVKSEHLGQQGTEGREAIRTALKELALCGYYRLERRQLLNGTFCMGTAISEEPVEEWVSDSTEYSGKAVPCIQQNDGSYLVRHKDGSLSEDGFEEAVDPNDGPEDDDPPPTPSPEDVYSGAGEPGPGSPDSGEPDSGSSGPIREKETVDREEERSASSLRSESAAAEPDEANRSDTPPPPPADALTEQEQTTGRDEDGKPLRGKKLTALAQSVTKDWWDWIEREDNDKPAQSFIACRSVVKTALANGHEPKKIKNGLAKITSECRAVSGGSLTIAMGDKPDSGHGMRRGYDDVATWGKYDENQPIETMSEAEIDAIFGPGPDNASTAAHG